MIYIGICDDEIKYRKVAESFCARFFSNRNLEFKCILFQSGDEVLAYNGEKLMLLFLDIEMDGTNGIEVMEKLQHNNNIWRIVFISSHERYIIDTFSLKTLGFCTKPLRYENMSKWLTIALQENIENKTVTFEENKKTGTIHIEDITYISAEGHYIQVHMQKENELNLFPCEIKSAEKLLMDTGIIRIHKSYMVNLAYVNEVLSTKVILQNKEITLPIGRTYKTIVQQKYNEYILEKVHKRLG
ncbi:MAG: LytR/AlgR family response regulator transcription factor [Coprococcus sp.]